MAATRFYARATRELLAKNLRRIRRDRGMTQEDLAQETGLRQAHLSEIEAGKRNISLDNIGALAHGLGVSIVKLFEE